MKKKKSIFNTLKSTICTIAAIFICIKGPGKIQSLINYQTTMEYKKVIEDFADFLYENDCISPKMAFDCFNYALWNGYLSNNHELSYSLKRNIYLHNEGIGCIHGESVCLNDASMLADVFQAMGYKSFVVHCCIEKGSTIYRIGSNENIERNIEKTEIPKFISEIIKYFQYVVGDHAITCVEYENEYYFYDPTNLAYLGKCNTYDLNIINGNGRFTIRYLSSFVIESASTIGIFNATNNAEYHDEVLDFKATIIPTAELEEFYQQEKDRYELIVDNSNGFIKGHLIPVIITATIFANTPFLVKDEVDKLVLKRKKKEQSEKLQRLQKLTSDN